MAHPDIPRTTSDPQGGKHGGTGRGRHAHVAVRRSGNVTSDTNGGVTKAYAYNAAGRMESLTVGTDLTEYAYNALGQQVIRRLSKAQCIGFGQCVF